MIKLLLIICISSLAIADGYSIASNETTKVVDADFAEFYNNAARRKTITADNKQNNPLLWLKSLESSSPATKQAAITQILQSIQDLPNSKQLITDFTKDLANISPTVSAEFAIAKLSLPTNKGVTKSTVVDNIASTATAINNIKFSKKADTFNAITTYNFINNNLYKIYTAPYKVTTISFAPNEIIGTLMCGDLMRWKINTIINKVGGVRYQYLTVQPLRPDLTTSITITTNQARLYVLEATSLANNYMAVVRWNYAED